MKHKENRRLKSVIGEIESIIYSVLLREGWRIIIVAVFFLRINI